MKTRKTCDALFELDCDPDNVPPTVRKIQPGGCGNIQTSGLAKRQTSEVTSNSQWNFTSSTTHYSSIHLPPHAIYCTECSHSETPPDSLKENTSEKHLLVDASKLSAMISKTCVPGSQEESL